MFQYVYFVFGSEYEKSLEDDVSGDTSGMFCRVLVSLLTVSKARQTRLSAFWRNSTSLLRLILALRKISCTRKKNAASVQNLDESVVPESVEEEGGKVHFRTVKT